ncbi:MAG TPA: hypothetical protein PLI19_06915 [Erysipelotrichaceae bacterium]|nr:hypothetical protein [Erysipelotrichaceae bacterium]
MGEPLGTEAVFLEMYAGGIYLYELNPLILLNYIIPFYYRGYFSYYRQYAEKSAEIRWGDFYVSED